MSYTAKVFNVMIASPADVKAERSIVREVIHDWNIAHSMTRKIVLMPTGWDTHSSPEMGASPQTIINKQVLEKCDLLIGLFGTKLGTATSEYASGTVEELQRHVEAGKPAMLYFSRKLVDLDSVDLEQFRSLKAFQESCKNIGLYEHYNDDVELRENFGRHLQIQLNQHSLFLDSVGQNGNGEVKSENGLALLSNEAKELLREVSLDPRGMVIRRESLSGTVIQTFGKSLVKGQEYREIARLEAAIQELVDQKMLVSRGQEGGIYQITGYGFKIADMIEF